MDTSRHASLEFIGVTDASSIRIVAALARDIWSEHYTPIIGKAQVEYMLEKFQSEIAIARQIKQENFLYYLLKESGRYIGYIGIVPRVDPKELFLSKIYVTAGERGRGVGRRAIDFIERLARDGGLTKICLTVNRNNQSAITAYQRLGFQNTGSVTCDIGSGFALCDYRMEKYI
jgi:GNAT superfamily N-acetyltransferase